MAHDCFRNTKKLENLHAAGQISDEDMKPLIIDAVDYCFDFLMKLCSPHGADILEELKQADKVPQWNDPEPMFLATSLSLP
jgi:hypothetical protein